MKYSTTKAVVNKIRPGTFHQNGMRGFGSLGRSLGDDTSGVSLSTDMMIGIAAGAVGVLLYCKHHSKIRG